jgi:Cu(I)/Ag(I) efflux system membrane protein CusA/SilA
VFTVVAIGCALGWWAMTTVPIDATPDQSDSQVVIVSHWDRSPDVIEDQVTYPIVTAMLGAPRIKTVRGISDFGSSYVYVIFEEGTDPYWARTRVVENLASVRSRLPEGAKTELGPDATALGWVFQYALVDTSGQLSLADLRSYQDWKLRYPLASVQGVAEVAPLGGFTRQYQVNVDPNMLQAYGISINRVIDAVRGGSSESGGGILEFGGSEYMVRGRGYATSIADFENIALSANQEGTVIRIKDIGQVVMGPDARRGVADLDGNGEVVSGVVVMRSGENALQVVDRVKARIREIEPGLPPGVRIVPVYDRSLLIRSAVSESKRIIVEVLVTVALIILLFLWHFPSAIIPLITLPVTLLLCFIPFRLMGLSANIMSLAGVAIALGELIDASIVVAEQTHRKLEAWESTGRGRDYQAIVLSAIREVAGPTFFALLVIAVSFLPVLTLEAQEGRMFRPLAYSKTLAMIVAAILALTLDPALRLSLTRMAGFNFKPMWLSKISTTVLVGRIRSQETHPLTRRLMHLYEPVIVWSLRWKWVVLGTAVALVAVTIPVFLHLGSELMPPLDEGSILYMPSTLPGISISEAKHLLILTDGILRQIPEVDRVLGKAGRADSSTDPAPLSMLETVITLKPRSEWRHIHTW